MMVPKQPLRTLLAAAPLEAVDLLEKLLVLNPDKRLTAEQALEHPYVRAFHKPEREPALDHDVVPTLSDAIQLTVDEYRTKLYEVIAQQQRNEVREFSPFKFIRDPVESGSPQGESKETKTIPKTKSSVDLSTSETRVAKKYSTISAPAEIPSVGSSRSNRSSTVDVPRHPHPDRKLVSRHSDDVLRNREKSSKGTNKTTNLTSSPSIARSHSGHCLVKYHLSNSSTESETGKSTYILTVIRRKLAYHDTVLFCRFSVKDEQFLVSPAGGQHGTELQHQQQPIYDDGPSTSALGRRSGRRLIVSSADVFDDSDAIR